MVYTIIAVMTPNRIEKYTRPFLALVWYTHSFFIIIEWHPKIIIPPMIIRLI
jgi:hypothetical protein